MGVGMWDLSCDKDCFERLFASLLRLEAEVFVEHPGCF